jgi:raffinose/stachyose/melibiose transport system permease protein
MKSKAYPFYFASGALALYLLFFVLPSVMGFYLRVHRLEQLFVEVNFVGLDNFRLIFSSGSGQNYLRFVRNTVVFTIATILLKTVIALGLAVLLTNGIRRLAYFHRVVMYLPAVLPMLVVSLVFKSILNPATGLLNTTCAQPRAGLYGAALAGRCDVGAALGDRRGHLARHRLHHGDPDCGHCRRSRRSTTKRRPSTAPAALAAFRRITLPLMMPVLTVTTVLNLLYGLKVFDIVFVLTNGGPGRATDTVYTAIFDEFSKGRYGVATTLSTLCF